MATKPITVLACRRGPRTWKSARWLAIDTETTGLDPEQDAIVELAAVSFEAGRVVERRSMLLNPGKPIPEGATAVHGIGDADVADAPTLDEVADRFLAHVGEAEVLVGYNWPFDASFLFASLGQRWTDAIRGKVIIDPLVVVRFDEVGRYWKGKGRHRLENVAARFGIALDGEAAHRASTDAILACRVLDSVVALLPDNGADATALIRRKRRQQDADFKAWKARQTEVSDGR